MEKSKIKKIGNSWYIKIPPNIHKSLKLEDDEEILIDQLGERLEIRFECDETPKGAALLDLKQGLALGPPKKTTREELYETNRY